MSDRGHTGAPHEFPAEAPRDLHPTSDIRFVIYEVGKLTTAVERLSADVRSQSEKIDSLRIRFAWVTGGAAVVGFLVALLLAALRFLPIGT